MPMKDARQLSRCRVVTWSESSCPPSADAPREAQERDAIPRPILIQSELRPQINPTNLIIGRQAVGRAVLEDPSVVHDVRAVSYAQRFTDVVVGDEDADASILEV